MLILLLQNLGLYLVSQHFLKMSFQCLNLSRESVGTMFSHVDFIAAIFSLGPDIKGNNKDCTNP